MAKRAGALKTTILGGAFFLIPFVVLLVIAGKAHEIMKVVAAPIVKAIGIEHIGTVALINLVAAAAIVVVCYAGGLLATSGRGEQAHRRLDDKLLDIFPRYGFIKSMAAGLHQESTSAMQVVSVRLDDQWQVGFEVERDAHGVVVYLPGSPDPWSGAVALVDADRVTPLQVEFPAAIKAMRLAGRGTLQLLQAQAPGGGTQSSQQG